MLNSFQHRLFLLLVLNLNGTLKQVQGDNKLSDGLA